MNIPQKTFNEKRKTLEQAITEYESLYEGSDEHHDHNAHGDRPMSASEEEQDEEDGGTDHRYGDDQDGGCDNDPEGGRQVDHVQRKLELLDGNQEIDEDAQINIEDHGVRSEVEDRPFGVETGDVELTGVYDADNDEGQTSDHDDDIEALVKRRVGAVDINERDTGAIEDAEQAVATTEVRIGPNGCQLPKGAPLVIPTVRGLQDVPDGDKENSS